MIRNIKEILPPKTGMREKQLLQDPGYVKGVKTTCCMLHGMLQGSTKYPMSKESKEIKIAIIQLRFKAFISYVEGVESSFDLQCRL